MLFFIPWVILFIAVIVAVPVAAKMSSGGKRQSETIDDEQVEVFDDSSDDNVNAIADDFGAEMEPMGDDAFAEFK